MMGKSQSDKCTAESDPSHFLVQIFTSKEGSGYVYIETNQYLNPCSHRRCNGKFSDYVSAEFAVRILAKQRLFQLPCFPGKHRDRQRNTMPNTAPLSEAHFIHTTFRELTLLPSSGYWLSLYRYFFTWF
jgi:hypothetical protein